MQGALHGYNAACKLSFGKLTFNLSTVWFLVRGERWCDGARVRGLGGYGCFSGLCVFVMTCGDGVRTSLCECRVVAPQWGLLCVLESTSCVFWCVCVLRETGAQAGECVL